MQCLVILSTQLDSVDQTVQLRRQVPVVDLAEILVNLHFYLMWLEVVGGASSGAQKEG